MLIADEKADCLGGSSDDDRVAGQHCAHLGAHLCQSLFECSQSVMVVQQRQATYVITSCAMHALI